MTDKERVQLEIKKEIEKSGYLYEEYLQTLDNLLSELQDALYSMEDEMFIKKGDFASADYYVEEIVKNVEALAEVVEPLKHYLNQNLIRTELELK